MEEWIQHECRQTCYTVVAIFFSIPSLRTRKDPMKQCISGDSTTLVGVSLGSGALRIPTLQHFGCVLRVSVAALCRCPQQA